jgi:hypothetical protein
MEGVERAGHIKVQGEAHDRQHKQDAKKDHDDARELLRSLGGLEEFERCEP